VKKIIFSLALVSLLLVITLISLAIYISFFKIKPITLSINNKIEDKLSKIVYVPKGVARPAYNTDSTTYKWEMETNQKEVAAVELSYTPSFLKSQEKIYVNLKMGEHGDPSIFDKSLPALINDEYSLKSSIDPKNSNPQTPPGAIFEKIGLQIEDKKGKAVSIEWQISKKEFGEELANEYKKLEKYPDFIFKFLYFLPQFLIDIFSGA